MGVLCQYQQHFNNIMSVSFIGRGKQVVQREPHYWTDMYCSWMFQGNFLSSFQGRQISCFCAACLSVSKANYTPTHRKGAILQSPCPFVRPFTLSLKMSHLLLEEMILFLIHDFGIVTCTMSPLSRLTTHLLPVYRTTYNFSCLP